MKCTLWDFLFSAYPNKELGEIQEIVEGMVNNQLQYGDWKEREKFLKEETERIANEKFKRMLQIALNKLQ